MKFVINNEVTTICFELFQVLLYHCLEFIAYATRQLQTKCLWISHINFNLALDCLGQCFPTCGSRPKVVSPEIFVGSPVLFEKLSDVL